MARRLKVKLAENWVTDDEGRPIGEEVDPPPNATQRMLPFGGVREQGSHKAYVTSNLPFCIDEHVLAALLWGLCMTLTHAPPGVGTGSPA